MALQQRSSRNVLITGAGGGVGQSVIRALRLSPLRHRLVGVDADPWAAGLYQCEASAIVPLARDSEPYLQALEATITAHGVTAVMVGTDTELPLLSSEHARRRLGALGAVVVAAEHGFALICRDKEETYNSLHALGLPFVTTQSLQAVLADPGLTSFPAIVKPRDGSASSGAKVVFSPADLAGMPDAARHVVQPYLVPESWSASPLRPTDVVRAGHLRQEDEVSIQGLVAPGGEVVGVFVSVNALRDGVPMRVVPTKDPGLLASARSAFRLLAGLGLVGPCNLQGRITAHGLELFEVNARFTGITAARAAMGFNECDAALALFADRVPPAEVASTLGYAEGVRCSRYITEQIIPQGEWLGDGSDSPG